MFDLDTVRIFHISFSQLMIPNSHIYEYINKILKHSINSREQQTVNCCWGTTSSQEILKITSNHHQQYRRRRLVKETRAGNTGVQANPSRTKKS